MNSYEYTPEHPILRLILRIFSEQIAVDINMMKMGRENEISYCAKWIPREKSSTSWMVPYIVKNLYKLNNRKCTRPQYYTYLKLYRKSISSLNRCLKTPEIKLCANEWSEIDLSNTSSLFIKKYYKNFMNLRSEFDSDDRKQCMLNFDYHIKQKVYNQMYKKTKKTILKKSIFQIIEKWILTLL